ncbi:MAG: xanthine dehydrogenase family protein molybdopterin-binding subunit [Betaproteobacteria bacterium]|nr:xanthine dehydrogenase family protein molybdopterin-binding subunit [Betaproteobacteria bacterium]
MSPLKVLARRTFLIGTAAVAGGLLVGVVAYRRAPENPLRKDLPAGAVALNAYVRIDAQGITLITPRADMGQGAYSLQAALIAEELDLAWGQFKVDPGPPACAYWNGKIPAEALPVAATSDTFFARTMRQGAEAFGKIAGFQMTGGSSTAADGFDRLRTAGAVARAMLLAAAAQAHQVPVEKLGTRDGQVLLPDGRAVPYLALAALAATLPVPDNVALKPASQWRYLGKPMHRLDVDAKTTGSAVFGLDVQLPGMVYATVRASPHLGSPIAVWHDEVARTLPGVLKIVRIDQAIGVIADSTWRAFKAAEALEIHWQDARYPATTAAMLAELAAAFTAKHRDSRLRNDGDVEAVLEGRGAAQGATLAAKFRVPFLAHAPLEPLNAVAQFKDGRLSIWTGTQIPRFLVKAAAKIANIAVEDVTLHAMLIGGSFGRRLEDDYVRQAVHLAVAYPGVPVKLTWTREEDMTHDMPRPLGLARARGRVLNGQVDALDLSIATLSVSASQMGRLGMPSGGSDVVIVAGAWDQPFAIPNYRVTGYRAPIEFPVSSWRSVGASGNAFFHESFLDELIVAAKADALAERLRLCVHEPSRRVLQAVGDMCEWSKPLPAGWGRGLAFCLSFGVPVAEVVDVRVDAAGAIKVERVFVAVECGRVLDPDNFGAQVEGGVLWGLGHAMYAELTLADGRIEQTNFHQFQAMRMKDAPRIAYRALQSTSEIRGIGEPTVPPAAPALANAIHRATGKRIRELPLAKHVAFA